MLRYVPSGPCFTMYGTRLPELRTATEKTVNKPKRKRRKPRTFIIFGFAENTLARQNASKLAFALAYSYFGFAEDTFARQNASKLAFALAYSYLCPIIA